MTQTTLDILLKFGIDATAAKQAAKHIDDINNKQKQHTTVAKEGEKKVKDLGTAIGTAVKAAAGFMTVNAAINAISGAVNNYIAKAGESEKVSQQWLVATDKINMAQTSIGRTLTTLVLPYYKDAAKFAEDIAAAAANTKTAYDKAYNDPVAAGKKRDPSLMGQDLMARPITTAVSAVSGAYAKSDPKTLLSDVLARPISTLAAVLSGQYGNFKETFGIVPPSFSLSKYDASGYSTGAAKANYTGMRRADGYIPGAANTADLAMPERPDRYTTQNSTVERLQMAQRFVRAEMEASRAAGIQKLKMARDFNKQEEYATADYQKTRRRSQRDFDIQVAFAEKEFYRQRAIANRDFNIQMVRSEQDYQRTRLRAGQDHEWDLYQIALSGDAMAYWQSERAFKIQQNRAKEDYDIQRNRSKEDFDRSQNDQLIQFEITRAQQLREYNIRRNDEAEDFEISRARRLYAYEISLKDMDLSLSEQKRLRAQALKDAFFAEQDNRVKLAIFQRDLTQETMDVMYEMALQGWNNIYSIIDGSLPNIGGGGGGGNDDNQDIVDPRNKGGWYQYEKGGYAAGGKSILHPGEFVLTKDTVRAAENVARGNLTQDTLLRMLGNNVRGSAVITQNVSTNVSSDTIELLKNEARSLLLEVL